MAREVLQMLASKGKLVRDLIPDIIAKSGRAANIVKLNDADFLKKLRDKVVEEATEVRDAEDIPSLILELADLQEVIDTLRAAYQISHNNIISMQNHRRSSRGGFDQRLFLTID